MNIKRINQLGWIASTMSVIMYFSYIDQIMRNLGGNKGSILLPIITIINCLIWVLYAGLKQKRDFPILICNLLGVIIGTITAITSF